MGEVWTWLSLRDVVVLWGICEEREDVALAPILLSSPTGGLCEWRKDLRSSRGISSWKAGVEHLEHCWKPLQRLDSSALA